jgi:hypothetical protein
VSHYYDEPETIDVDERTADLAESLARSAAACVTLYGPRHGAVWDESTDDLAASMLTQIHEAGARVIHAGAEDVPADGDRVTWRRDDAPEYERRAWVEFRLPDEPAVTIDRDAALVAHEAIDQLLILDDKTAMSARALRRTARQIEDGGDIRPTPRTRPEPTDGESRDGEGGTRPVPSGVDDSDAVEIPDAEGGTAAEVGDAETEQ